MFEKLNWGPIPNPEHDVGTDLFVQVRDADLNELGLVLGVQVKNESGYFASKPQTGPSGEVGWWYRAKKGDDVKLWLKHATPHIIALYNESQDVAYWGHVTLDMVQWTPRAAKIFIPLAQQVNESSRTALVETAGTARPPRSWAGSTWGDGSQIAPADRLRYAILTPRIVAQHPNRPAPTITAEQGIAGLMLCRDGVPREPEPLAQWSGGPTREGNGWRWDLHDAIHAYLTSKDLEPLRSCRSEAAAPPDYCAATALLVGFMREQGDLRATIELLGNGPEPDNAIDAAWLRMHRASAEFELGNLEVALDLALEVAAIRVGDSHDATAVLLTAAAANCAFSAGDFSSDRIEKTILASDTPSVWWRSQHRAWGLSGYARSAFTSWASPSSKQRERTSRKGWRHLRGLSLQCAAAGDHQSWRHEIAELVVAEINIAAGDLSHDDCVEHLQDLVLSGEKDLLYAAVNCFLQDGPCTAVKQVAEATNLAASTRSSLQTSIQLVGMATDVLSESDRDRHAAWALDVLSGRQELAVVKNRSWSVVREVVDLLRHLVPWLTVDMTAKVKLDLLGLPAVSDQSFANHLGLVFTSIPSETWTDDELDQLVSRLAGTKVVWPPKDELTSFGDHWELANAIRSVLGRRRDVERLSLLEGVKSGDYMAIISIRRLDNLPEDVVTGAMGQLTLQIDAAIADFSRDHASSMGVLSPGGVLISLNTIYPNHADWSPIVRLLGGPASPWDQHGVLITLIQAASQVPPDIAEALMAVLFPLTSGGKASFFDTDVPKLARQALEALRQDDLELDELWKLLRSGTSAKESIAMALGRRPLVEGLALLAALGYDEEPAVSASAAWAATRWALAGVKTETTTAMVADLLNESGSRRANAVAAGLSTSPREAWPPAIVTALRSHPAASVRQLIVEGAQIG